MNQATIKKVMSFFNKNGYAVIEDFISPKKCEDAIQEIDRLITEFQPTPQSTTIFDGESGQSKHRMSQYFMDSASKVHFFFQPKAIGPDGKFIHPKAQSINKIGHSLHEKNKIFQQITYTQGVQQLCSELGITKPLVTQSMAIMKNKKIGAQVNIHQDSTYLYCQPQTLIGFWIPLQDATIQNGCLWGVPGSHLGKLYKRSKVINREPRDQIYHQPDWKIQDFVPLQMKRGSLAIFTGRFLHMSKSNTSDKSRYAYTWHLMDQRSHWSKQNWLQRDQFPKFPLKKAIN